MNKVFMVGRLSQDPQQFVTQNGITQSRISIACNDSWNKNETYFFPCVAWQTTANFINSYLHKGDLVAIDGKLIRRSYVSKEGKTVYVVEVVVESIKPLSTRNNSNDSLSSIDKNFKNESVSKSNKFSNFEEKTINEFKNESSNETNISENDDPFAMSNDDEEENIVDLDWLDEFKN